MEGETCRMCGGDGRIGNALGKSTATCPSCHGSGRRAEYASAFRDVTKTKPSHYRPTPSAAAPAGTAGPRAPVTLEGVQLAVDVNDSTLLTPDAKVRLVAEIVNHESTHGRCTKTFMKKIRKQARPGSA
jgi:DnaJ-class molecular chaperone